MISKAVSRGMRKIIPCASPKVDCCSRKYLLRGVTPSHVKYRLVPMNQSDSGNIETKN